MSYNGKYVSFLEVVESAHRDSGVDKIDYEAVVGWASELIEKIGVGGTFINKVTNGENGMPSAIAVNANVAILPSDLVRLTSVRKVNLNGDGEIVSYNEMIETSDNFYLTDVAQSSPINNYWNPLVNQEEFSIDGGELKSTTEQIEINQSSNDQEQYVYKLDDGKVYANFATGYIQIAYKGYPIDSYGYPLIPDDIKFKEALKHYIIYKLDWKRWRMNPSPQNASIKNDSEQQYLFYIASARNKYHIPSIDKMEAIKNMWLRTIPNINNHADGFKTLNYQERQYNNNRK